MRAVFADMERIQQDFLEQAGISAFDARLRSIRETARSLFERVSAYAAGRGSGLAAETPAALYAACLYHALQAAGIEPPQNLLPENKLLMNLVTEVPR